ncbi:MAG: hypothetical protein B7X42_05760 [Thiomonas sp. 14-66-4]|nr:MAG: hypothetical protein B7X42_05760 [Thiomonas sp. 14-66-4]
MQCAVVLDSRRSGLLDVEIAYLKFSQAKWQYFATKPVGVHAVCLIFDMAAYIDGEKLPYRFGPQTVSSGIANIVRC